jgi:cytochrome b subunit of formate dehydrogenase
VPDSSFDRELEALLEYNESPQDTAFVANVMRSVQREQHIRKLILWAFGLVGALFGLAGAVMLSDSITRLFTFTITMPAMETMQVALFVVAVAAFYIWFMNDDLPLDS